MHLCRVEHRMGLADFQRIPVFAFKDPAPARKCDALFCESMATHECSGHGVAMCVRHYEHHKVEFHAQAWERVAVVGRC